MSNKIPQILIACVLLFSTSTCMARYPNTTSYLIKICENTPDSTLCLQTLIPVVDRVDQDYKKLTRLTMSAASDAAQSTVEALTKQSEQPNLWTREVTALTSCTKMIKDTRTGLDDLLEETYHLGGGTKDEKEAKRQKMMSNAKAVSNANKSCVSRLMDARARDVLISRVREMTDVLVRQASNVYYILDHFAF